MANQPANLVASVRQRFKNLALENSWGFDVVLIAFGLERLIYRLSVSDYRGQFVLKGGMLVTLWTIEFGRFTRDVDFLAFVENNEANLKAIFTDILPIDADDGLVFDTGKLQHRKFEPIKSTLALVSRLKPTSAGRKFRSPLIWGLAMY